MQISDQTKNWMILLGFIWLLLAAGFSIVTHTPLPDWLNNLMLVAAGGGGVHFIWNKNFNGKTNGNGNGGNHA